MKMSVDRRVVVPYGQSRRLRHTNVICPKCNKWGQLKYKRHKSYFYPENASVHIINLKRLEKEDSKRYQAVKKYVKGSMYMSEARAKHDWKYIQSLERTDHDQYVELKKAMTKDAYAVKYDSEIHYPCVMHYDPQLYLRQKSAHRLGQRKSKPNGIVFHYYRR